ncbi:hypothetical protein D1871_16015 [Nakamurella silvestris]|nr:hypothetical protein D1871_16015 [Nakamurella silvestris]
MIVQRRDVFLPSFWLKYTYDDKGNRTQQKSLAPAKVNGAADETTDYTYTTPGHAHALTSTSRFTAGAPTAKTTAGYTYDAAGAVTGRTSTASGQSFTAAYTDDGRTKTLNTTGTSTTAYVYDADGNILIRRDPVNTDTTPATTTTVRTAFIGSDQYRVVAGTTGITTTRQYTHAGVTIAERVGTAPISWLFTDANHTVSVAVATTTGGAIGTTTRRFFDPFGKTLAPTTGGTWPDNNKFLNTPTNTLDLVDMGARLYDPGIGRFLTVDPILTPYQPRQNNG